MARSEPNGSVFPRQLLGHNLTAGTVSLPAGVGHPHDRKPRRDAFRAPQCEEAGLKYRIALRRPCRPACYQAPKRRSEIFDMASQSRDDLKPPPGYADLGRKDKVPISRPVLALHPKKTQGTMKCGCNRPRQKGCCDWPNGPAYRAKRRS
jgi:hypothetical protein